MTPAAITVRHLWKFYGDFPAVRDVNLEVAAGSILALLGRNGAGKTTLLRIVAGLLRPSRGSISLATAPSEAAASAARLGIVGHGQWLYEDLTARENLEFFARLYEVADYGPKADHWLEVSGLTAFRHARVSEFSRGMRQRLTIARAFLHEPPVLLLDEPWTALDDRAMDLLSSLLLETHQRRHTVVVCSHQLRETLDVATELAVLERGRLIFTGPNNEELKASPYEFYQKIT